jgi:uncharacterized phage protein gp47/JayE
VATELATPAELAVLAQQKLRALMDPAGTGAVDLSPGSRNDNMISVNTALYTRAFQYAADRLTSRSLSTATGDDLDALVLDIYQDTRKLANEATGTVYLQRTGTSATVIPQGTKFAVPSTSTQTGVEFICTVDTPVATNAGLAGSPISVPVQCVVADRSGNVAVALITQIKDALPDTTWSIATAPAGALLYIAGGDIEEDDDTFRSRIQQSAFDDSKRRGTVAAIRTGTLQVPGVSNVTVVEPGDGTLLVFCGDTSYNLSAAMQSAVQVELEDWRAFGIPPVVRPYSVVTVYITATMYMQRPLQNYSQQALQTQALANVLSYFANRKRPDEFYGSAVSAAIMAAHVESQQVIFNTVTTSASPQPDGTGSIRRVSDSLYGSVTSMVRYVVSSASVQINIAPPLTQ